MSEEKPQPKEEQKAKVKAESVLDRALKLSDEDVMPWEEVTLPSQGAFYDGEVPGGRIEVKPMGLAAEKVLATQRLAQSGKSIDWLFRKCVRFPNEKFDPINLLAGDRIFLLYYLRGITHGNMYEFVVNCSNEACQTASTHEYDLNGLSSTITKPEVGMGEEPFKVRLPHLSEVLKEEFSVKVRFLRGYDMNAMLTNRRVNRRAQGVGKGARMMDSVDETLEDNLNMLVVEAGDSKDKGKIRQIVSRLHAKDTASIREFLRVNSPGIDTTILINCPNCSQEMRMELPITESFFRPTAARKS
jgi:hypothetical protein